jgi:hypothetical protein
MNDNPLTSFMRLLILGWEGMIGWLCVCITCGLGGLIPLAFIERWLSRGDIFSLLSMVGRPNLLRILHRRFEQTGQFGSMNVNCSASFETEPAKIQMTVGSAAAAEGH